MSKKLVYHAIPNSSNIAGFCYNPSTKELLVDFVGSRCYLYSKVPKILVKDWEKAESKGSFFHRNIRPIYECTEITNDKSTRDTWIERWEVDKPEQDKGL